MMEIKQKIQNFLKGMSVYAESLAIDARYISDIFQINEQESLMYLYALEEEGVLYHSYDVQDQKTGKMLVQSKRISDILGHVIHDQKNAMRIDASDISLKFRLTDRYKRFCIIAYGKDKDRITKVCS